MEKRGLLCFFCSADVVVFRRYSHASKAALLLYCSEDSLKVLLEVAPPARCFRSPTHGLRSPARYPRIFPQRMACIAPTRYPRIALVPQRLSPRAPALRLLQRAPCVLQRLNYRAPAHGPRAPAPSLRSPAPGFEGGAEPARRARARAEGVLRACRGRCIQNKKAVRSEPHKWRVQTLTTFICALKLAINYLFFSISFFSTIVPISGSRSTSMYGCKSPFPIGLYV